MAMSGSGVGRRGFPDARGAGGQLRRAKDRPC